MQHNYSSLGFRKFFIRIFILKGQLQKGTVFLYE